MKSLVVLALVAGATLAHAQTKKELAQKIVTLQQAAVEGIARNLVQQPASLMVQEAERVLRTQVPEERRPAITSAVNAATKKYMDEALPLLRERALKLAPTAFGGPLEEKFSEDELKQIVTWMESPTSKKFQQITGDAQNAFVQTLVAEGRPLIDPKVAVLDQAVRAAFAASAPASGAAAAPSAGASAPATGAAKPRATAPARPASK